jgi:hypothetical protein
MLNKPANHGLWYGKTLTALWIADLNTWPCVRMSRSEKKRPIVVFCTYQSSDSLFSTVLDDSKIKAKRRLFMTATPRDFSEKVKKKATEKEYDLVSMDDEKRFGPEFHVYNFGEAISNGELADYRVAIIGTTDNLISLPATITNMKEEFKPDGDIWTDYISYKIPTSTRKALLKKFAELPGNTRGVIGNKACLGEGVDVPEFDGIALIDPKGSEIAIVQVVGGAIRKPGKFRLDLRREEGGGKVQLSSKFEVDLPISAHMLDFENTFYVRAVLNSTSVPPLTTEEILEWADAHYARHGSYPSSKSGAVEGVACPALRDLTLFQSDAVQHAGLVGQLWVQINIMV